MFHVPRSRSTTLLFCVVWAAAGCSASGERFGVALTLTTAEAPVGIDDTTLATVRSFVIEAAGDETYSTTLDLGERTAQRIERTFYLPRTSTRNLTISVAAADKDGNVLLEGSSAVLLVEPDRTTAVQILLLRPGLTLDDMGVPQADGGVDAAGQPRDFAGFDGALISAYSHPITVPHGSVGLNGTGVTLLSDFPLFVRYDDATLRSAANGGHVLHDTGSDIEFVGKNAAVCAGQPLCVMEHEIESYDPVAGVVVAWVRIPALNTVNATSDTSFVMRYGATPLKTHAQGSVWANGFRGVWHLGDPAATTVDSTQGLHNGTRTDVVAGPGRFGLGSVFNGSTSHIDVPSALILNFAANADFTMSVWLKSNQPTTTPGLIGKNNLTTSQGYQFAARSGAAGTPWAFGVLSGGNTIASGLGSVDAMDDSWHLLAATRQAGTLYLYEDGVLTTTVANATANLTSTTPLRMGAMLANATDVVNPFQGTLDEVRIATGARSADWMKAEYSTGVLAIGAEVFE